MVLQSRDEPFDWDTDDEDPLSWQRRALCLNVKHPFMDYDPWFDPDLYHEAMEVCNGLGGGPVCPVRQRCLHRAMVNNEMHGIWGGMLRRDRKALKDKYPTSPEEWIWQPPTVEPCPPGTGKKRRRRRRKSATPASATSSPPAAPRL